MAALEVKRPRSDLTEDDFNELKIEINGSLEEREVHTLKYLCMDKSIGLAHGPLHDCKSGLSLFQMLEDRMLLSNKNLDLLIELLDLIRRTDLKTKVGEYGTLEVKKTISSYRRMVLEITYEITSDGFDALKTSTLKNKISRKVIAELTHPIQMMCALELRDVIEPDNVEFLLTICKHLKRSLLVKEVQRYQQEALVGRYKMDSKTRGLCIIINNINFSALEERKGSEIDQEKLTKLFKKLGFAVCEKTNLTAGQMSDLIQEASKEDHSNFDCFVCCILSHGNTGVVSGVDGKTCRIMDIARHMRSSNCPSLANKPKMFFVQACRGETKETKVDLNPSFNDDQTEESELITENADFLFGYATTPGSKANLNMQSGSTYINKLTEVVDKHYKDLDILSMLTLVNKEVCKVDLEGPNSKHKVVYGQTPSPHFTFTKKLYFN